MPKKLELSPRYGKLTIFPEDRLGGQVRAVCDCGKERWCIPAQLVKGNTKCCKDCLDYSAIAKKADPKTARPEYWVWDQMIRRCHAPSNKAFGNYGGRGIFVCERWRDSFEDFYADMGPRPGGKREFSIERVDNDGPYSPENCRWVRIEVQPRNTRRNRVVTYRGRRVRLLDLCAGMDADEIETRRQRIDGHGWSVEDAIDIPIGVRR